MSRFKLSRPARTDLDKIWIALAHVESADFASRTVDELMSSIRTIGLMPQSGRARSDIAPDARMFPSGDYVIYYRAPKRGGVLISRVVHGMRDQWKALKKSKPRKPS